MARGLFDRRTGDASGTTMPALPVPVDPGLRTDEAELHAPELGERDLGAEP